MVAACVLVAMFKGKLQVMFFSSICRQNVKMFMLIHGQGECSSSHIFFLYFFLVGFKIQGQSFVLHDGI